MFSRAIPVLALLSFAGALDVFGTNDYLAPIQNQLLLTHAAITHMVEPLTGEAGRARNRVELSTWNIVGDVKSATSATMNTITKDDIAVVNCGSLSSTDSVSPSTIVQILSEKKPKSIILYSFDFARCEVKDTGDYQSYYTLMNSTNDALKSLINVKDRGAIRAIASSTAQQPNVQPQQNEQRTPAVAMSILYAVTGIITVLFLVIIATGAWRAHMNPERYGPRTGFAGRPRQSRAKGLARAMLETLPIVKFGDPVPTKGENGDVELQRTSAEGPPLTNHDGATDKQDKPEVQSSATALGPRDGNSEESAKETSVNRESEVQGQGSNAGCSICTEDFQKGEDVRVLPCNHQYHPNCIDPWLLNVSGTCPLCRVDLRPVPEVEPAANNTAEVSSSTTAAPDANRHHHPRLQRILALRHVAPHERIATLRQLATESGREQGHNTDSEPSAEEERHRRRVAERLRSALRIRTRRASTSGASRPAQATTSAQAENTDMTGGADGAART